MVRSSRYRAAGREANLLVDLVQSALGDGKCLLSAFAVAAFQIALVCHQAVVFLTDWAQLLGNRFADSGLEVAVAVAFKFGLNLLKALAGDRAVDCHQVVDAVLAFAVCNMSLRVGDSALKFLDDGILGVEQENGGLYIFVRFGHLLARVCQRHDFGRGFWNVGIRDSEGVSVQTVEAEGNIAGQLEVLLLVDAHRN